MFYSLQSWYSETNHFNDYQSARQLIKKSSTNVADETVRTYNNVMYKIAKEFFSKISIRLFFLKVIYKNF